MMNHFHLVCINPTEQLITKKKENEMYQESEINMLDILFSTNIIY